MLAGGEAGVMPIGQCTHAGVSRQVRFQPLLLRRTGATSTHLATIRVQGNQMPGTDVITIVTFGAVASRGTEIIVVTAKLIHFTYTLTEADRAKGKVILTVASGFDKPEYTYQWDLAG